MKKVFLRNKLPVLAVIEAGEQVEKVELFPHSEGLACEIKGRPNSALLESIYYFFDAYVQKRTVPPPPLLMSQVKGPFTYKVLTLLPTLGFGKTETYRMVAARLDSPQAARAVGNACGRNPFPFFLPCHRVVGHNGLGGFSAGLELKKYLLNFESSQGSFGQA